MENKLLEENLEHILDEIEYIVDGIYSYRKEPDDMEYFISVYLDEEGRPRILIDDIWSIDYSVQIYDFYVENIVYMTRNRLKDILRAHLTQSIEFRINELELLIANAKAFIKNNIDDIIKTAKDYHTHNDTYYLVIGIQDSNLYYQFDTITEIAYFYPIYDTSEDISEVSNPDDLIKFRLMDSLNIQIENWKMLLNYLKEK